MQAAQDSTVVRIIRGFAVSLMIAGGREFEILQPCCLHPGQLTMSELLIGCCRGIEMLRPEINKLAVGR